MSARSGSRAAKGIAAAGARLARAWRRLPHERRLAAYAAAGLFVTLFLPWYHETVVAVGKKASTSVTGWEAFSFVEAAVLVVAGGVLTLLFQRAEGRAFHLPGGDGWVITAAGLWTCVLVIWRIFDKQSVQVHGPGTTISGIEWGIFVALAVAAVLAQAGSRIRAAHRPEPPLPGDEEVRAPRRGRSRAPAVVDAELAATAVAPAPPRRRSPLRDDPRFPRPEPPEDPPALRLRRAKPSPAPPAAEEQLTMPLDDQG